MERREFITKAAALGLVPASAIADPAGGVYDSDVVDRIFRTVNGARRGSSICPVELPACLSLRDIHLEKITPDMAVKGWIDVVYRYDPEAEGKFAPPVNRRDLKWQDFYRQIMGVGINQYRSIMTNDTHSLLLELNVIAWDWKRKFDDVGFIEESIFKEEYWKHGYGVAFKMPFTAYGSYKRDPIRLEETPLQPPIIIKSKEKLYDAVVPKDDSKIRKT